MTTQSKRTVAFALCGSFCSFAAVLPQLRVLTARGWDVLPVLSASAAGLDTRFGTASALRGDLPPRGKARGISTPLYAAFPPAYYSSSGWICTPRSAASNVSGRSVKSLFRLHGFL